MTTRFPLNTEKTALSLLALISLGVILLFIALGQYAAPSADDFCMAEGVQREGVWTHLWNHYFEWSGRYSGNALYAIYPMAFGLLEGYKFIALLLLLSLFTATAFFLSRLLHTRMNGWTVCVAALIFVAVYVLGMRSPASSLYWMAGSLSYQSANILLLLLAGLMFQLSERQREGQKITTTLIALTGVLVLAIGANETGMLMAFVATGVMLLARLRQGWQIALPWLLLFLVALVCSAIVFGAPGNAVREATFPLRHDLMRSLAGSFAMGLWTLTAWLQNPVFIVATVLTPFMTALLCRNPARQFHPSKWQLLTLLVGTLLLPFLLEFPAWWAMGGWPPPRTVDAIYFVFLCGWLFTVGAITLYFMPNVWREHGLNAQPRALTAFLITAVLFGLAVFTNGKFQRAQMDWRETAPAFDAYMQQRYAMIADALNHGQQTLSVPDFGREYPRSVYFNDILPMPTDWRNVCYAQYFGLQSIQRHVERQAR
jgi:hypothetical protein